MRAPVPALPPAPLPHIARLRAYHTHTGTGPAPKIRLSFNEGALGPSPAAVAAMQTAMGSLSRYPEMCYSSLRQAIATHFNLNETQILCGAGSDEIITLLPRVFATAGDDIIYSQYGFAVYPITAQLVGATGVAVPEPSMEPDIDGFIARLSPRTKLVFLANPNNPTGSMVGRAALGRLIAALPPGALLVYDAAYADYVDDPDYTSGFDLVAQHPNVLVLRTFSKIHALGGLRVGFAYGAPSVIDALNRARNPFNIGGPSVAAAIASLADTVWQAKVKAHNLIWRQWLWERLQTQPTLKVYPSAGNFLLVGFGTAARAKAVYDYLLAADIQVRPMASYALPDHLRITIGNAQEMEALWAALTAFLGRE